MTEVTARYYELSAELARSDISLEEMNRVSAEIKALKAEHPEEFPTAKENEAALARIKRFGAAKTRK